MYLSYLVIDTGGNPDRPRPGRQWLSNIYAVHQRLCMGFPTQKKYLEDSEFLSPFLPDNFTKDGEPPYYLQRKGEKPKSNRPEFLFRIDNQIHGNQRIAIIGIQSELKPNWEYAFQNSMHLLSSDFPIAEPKKYNPVFSIGDTCCFRININLSKKSSAYNKNGKERNRKEEQGRRVALTWDSENERNSAIRQWFENKIERSNLGFSVKEFNVVKVGWKLGWKHVKNKDKPDTLRFRSALLEGTLEVSNTDNFLNTIKEGIGSAKAFGFGLLSVKKI
jgi:CRISPR system Cascade subunit CasE